MPRDELRPRWIRAGEPLVLHSLVPDAAEAEGWRRALCGADAFGWRRIDDLTGSAAVACAACAEAVRQLPG